MGQFQKERVGLDTGGTNQNREKGTVMKPVAGKLSPEHPTPGATPGAKFSEVWPGASPNPATSFMSKETFIKDK